MQDIEVTTVAHLFGIGVVQVTTLAADMLDPGAWEVPDTGEAGRVGASSGPIFLSQYSSR